MRYFRHLFAYHAWANREVIASLRAVSGASVGPALRLLGHIAATKRLWLGRVLGDPTPVAVRPDLRLADCETALDDADSRWAAFLAGLRTEDHAHYHRGQIAAQVRVLGHEPAYTDFIHAVRTHALPSEGGPP